MCAFLFRKQRRRRDLTPRAATNDLLPFQGSPFGQLGYFSKVSASYVRYSFSSSSLSLYLSNFSVVILHLQGKQKEVHSVVNFPSGEGGIRTHAPSRTNGFQDRLVMTTSIPLQTSCSSYRLNCLVCSRDNVYSSITLSVMSTLFSHFFYFFV